MVYAPAFFLELCGKGKQGTQGGPNVYPQILSQASMALLLPGLELEFLETLWALLDKALIWSPGQFHLPGLPPLSGFPSETPLSSFQDYHVWRLEPAWNSG